MMTPSKFTNQENIESNVPISQEIEIVCGAYPSNKSTGMNLHCTLMMSREAQESLG